MPRAERLGPCLGVSRDVLRCSARVRARDTEGDVRIESVRLPTADIGRRAPYVAFVPRAAIPR
jgi:hypothetical protein